MPCLAAAAWDGASVAGRSVSDPILVVDDGSEVLASESSTLLFKGYTNVLTLHDARHVMDSLEAHSADVVLLDGGDHRSRQALAQYVARAPLSRQKLTYDQPSGKVLYHSAYNAYFRQSNSLWSALDFIAQLTPRPWKAQGRRKSAAPASARLAELKAQPNCPVIVHAGGKTVLLLRQSPSAAFP